MQAYNKLQPPLKKESQQPGEEESLKTFLFSYTANYKVDKIMLFYTNNGCFKKNVTVAQKHH
jgi:hypothetical protein